MNSNLLRFHCAHPLLPPLEAMAEIRLRFGRIEAKKNCLEVRTCMSTYVLQTQYTYTVLHTYYVYVLG